MNQAAAEFQQLTGHPPELVRTHVILGNRGGRLKLLGIPKPVDELLTLTRLHTVFESFDAEQDAVRSFSS